MAVLGRVTCKTTKSAFSVIACPCRAAWRWRFWACCQVRACMKAWARLCGANDTVSKLEGDDQSIYMYSFIIYLLRRYDLYLKM